jgi:hypothetical protein
MELPRTELTASLQVGQGKRSVGRSAGLARQAPARAGGRRATCFPDGVISNDDLDAFRSAWYSAQTAATQCADSPDNAAADANGDGCIDVVDIQALLAAEGQQRAAAGSPARQDSALARMAYPSPPSPAGPGHYGFHQRNCKHLHRYQHRRYA